MVLRESEKIVVSLNVFSNKLEGFRIAMDSAMKINQDLENLTLSLRFFQITAAPTPIEASVNIFLSEISWIA